jgi:uncharacterized protein YukE
MLLPKANLWTTAIYVQVLGCRCWPIQSPLMSNAAAWAGTAGNKFRQAARESTSAVTTLLAEGLTALAEAIRELDQELENVRR